MAAPDGHPFRQIVYNVWRLKTPQCLAMSWNGSFVECADVIFVCSSDHFLLLLRVTPIADKVYYGVLRSELDEVGD